MSIRTRVTYLWRNLVQRRDTELALDEELLGFERLLIEEKLRGGLNPADARRAARLEIGGFEQVKENVRAERNSAWLEGLLQDVRYGWRSLARVPAFTGTAIVALALGIGASTAIFSVVNGVLLRPLPYQNPDAIVTLLHGGTDPVASQNFLDWRAQTRSFSTLAAAQAWSPNIAGAGDAERVNAMQVTAGMFPLLGVPPLLGRTFGAETENAGRDHEVVLGYDIWTRRFGADSTVLGRPVLLDGESYVVVGVMPRNFEFAPFWRRDAQLWAPLAILARTGHRDDNSLRVFARRKAGVTLQQARTDVATVTAQLEQQFPRTNTDVQVTPLMEQATAGLQRPLVVLLIAVSFLLLAACANVAHMMLARSSSRQREMAVRIAIGASPARLTRQLLCESLMLSLAGGALGLLLAAAGMRALILLAGTSIPRSENIHIDLTVLLTTLGITVLTGMLFGLAPARNATRTELVSSLKDGGRSERAGSAHSGFRNVLVASQFAIALTLLVGAGLMMRTLSAVHDINPGFNPAGVITAEVSVNGTPSSAAGNRAVFYQQLVEKVQALPGVQVASAINHLPLAGDMWGFGVTLENQVTQPDGARQSAVYRVVLPNYFGTMGIRLQRGRDFTSADRAGSTPVAIVNEQFANRYWPGENALGKRFALGAQEADSMNWLTVVAVSANVVRQSWTEAPQPEMYIPFLQDPAYLENPAGHFAYLTLVARTGGDAQALVSSVRRVVAELDRGASVSALQTMDAVVNSAAANRQFYFVLLSAFAGVALVLAAVGIYGVMSHAVSQRMHEMGVRIALGAGRRDVMQLIVGRGMLVVFAGALAGVFGAFGLTRLMNTIIDGVGAADPITFGAGTALLLLVAMLACWIPARRATRADPLTALRGD